MLEKEIKQTDAEVLPLLYSGIESVKLFFPYICNERILNTNYLLLQTMQF